MCDKLLKNTSSMISVGPVQVEGQGEQGMYTHARTYNMAGYNCSAWCRCRHSIEYVLVYYVFSAHVRIPVNLCLPTRASIWCMQFKLICYTGSKR